MSAYWIRVKVCCGSLVSYRARWRKVNQEAATTGVDVKLLSLNTKMI